MLHRRTTFGRQLTAIGNNEEVARRIGIPVDRRTLVTLLISGAFAAIAGVIYTLQVGVNTAKIGDGMEFTAVAAVVVGGVSLFGGRGNILVSVILGGTADHGFPGAGDLLVVDSNPQDLDDGQAARSYTSPRGGKLTRGIPESAKS